MKIGAAALLAILIGSPASAQIDGHVSVMFDAFPDLGDADGSQFAGELRTRLYAERQDQFGDHLRINLSGYVDALVANRRSIGGVGTTTDAIVRPADLYVDIVTSRFEIRAGAARLVWGRLDEFQPTDVVNPLDLSRFLMEGRSEARLAVGLVRWRMFLPGSTTVDAVVVPAFRAGRFDQLDEPTSPFNLTRSTVPTVREEPPIGSDSVQGGVRVATTTARVDWGVSAYRGIRGFPIATLAPDTAGAGFVLRETFPHFTMIGADFESVKGAWGVRGEFAAFVEDELQSTRALRGVPGHSVTAGVGADRRAGDYRLAANALWSWSGVNEDKADGLLPAEQHDELERSDISLVFAADRSFARETRTLRVFAVYDPADSTTFTRVIGAVSLRDNCWLEGSGGLFTGGSFDVIGRLTRRDFVYARLKVFF